MESVLDYRLSQEEPNSKMSLTLVTTVASGEPNLLRG
jgi:hypothetical protein